MARRLEIPAVWASGPFSTRAARAAGVGRHVLERPDLTRVTRGVRHQGEIDLETRLEGLRLVLPTGVVFSCSTAAMVWDLPVKRGTEALVHVRVPKQVRRAGISAHVSPDVERVVRHRLPVTPPLQTFVDLAAHVDDAWLLATGDAIVRRRYASIDELRVAVSVSGNRRGIVRARTVAALVRDGVDSPMESLLRHLLLGEGLPEPAINADVFDSHGGWIARPDLSYPDRRIAIEYDGRHHIDDRRQWENDIARRHNLEDEGWVVRVMTARDVLVQPRRTASNVLALWRRRA